ncbi:MAG: hypothetical protein ACOC4G_12235 [Bacillota bacterium]
MFFYVPLAATSILMMTTHSFFNAALSRLSSPEIYLSAFAVAKSLMHIFEGPIMMVRQTVSTLVHDAKSYFKVRKFFLIVTLLTVAVMSVISLSDLSNWIYIHIFGVERQVAEKAVIMLIIFTLFPVAAALRNFMQGIAVKLNKTPLFTIATIARLIYVFFLVLIVDKFTFISGAVFAGLMFLTAVGLEGVVICLGVKISEKNIPGKLKEIKKQENEELKPKINHSYIFRFFWPLIVTSIIHMTAMPLVNMGLARTYKPSIAISAFTVGWSLGLFFLSPAFLFHQQVIKYYENSREKIRSLKKFAILLGTGMLAVLAIVAFTDIGYYILRNWIEATDQISVLALDVLKLMLFMVPVILFREYYWGVLLKENKTRFVSYAKIINLISIVITIFVLLKINPANPAILGVLVFIVAEGSEAVYLSYAVHKKI